MASDDNNVELIKCKNPECKKKFPRKSIRIHLIRSKKLACSNHYTDEELEAFKNSSKKIHNEKKKVAQREGYDEEKRKERGRKHQESYDAEKKKERSRKYQEKKEVISKRYQKNKKAISRKYKEKKENAKKESTPEQRILDFRRANQHAPIFTCISCHRDRFKNGVKELTKKLESKIRDNGMYRYILILTF